MGQIAKLSDAKKELLLQLSLNYHTVVKEGRVDQDSSLVLVSKLNKISRFSILTEGFGPLLHAAEYTWFDTRQTAIAKTKLSSLHGLDHLKLLVALGAYYAFQPGYHTGDRDSAQYFLSQAKRESEILRSDFWLNHTLCLLGKNYFKGKKVKEGIACFSTLITRSQKQKDLAMEAKAWYIQGTYIPPSANTLMLIISSLEKANGLYKQTLQQEKRSNTCLNLAYIYFLLKDLKAAEANALTSLSIIKKINFPYTHYNYDLLSLIDISRGLEHKFMVYEMQAVKAALATKDSLGLGNFYLRLGMVSWGPKSTRYTFSNYWLNKSIAEFRRTKNPDIYFALLDLTDNLSMNGRSGEAIKLLQKTLKNIPPPDDRVAKMAYLGLANSYWISKQYPLAEKYLLLTDRLQDRDSMITKDYRNSALKLRIGKFYYVTKKYEKARAYLEKSLATPGPKENEVDLLSDAHMYLYKIDSLSGDYGSALTHLRKYISITNKFVSTNDAKGVAGLKLQVLMTQKEKDLQVLQAKSALQNQRASTTRKFIFIGIAVSLLVIIMLYSRYLIKRRQGKEMDKKNAELLKVIKEKNDLLLSKEWLLKEVHHRVKNNLHTIICLLESQAGYLEKDALKAIEISQHRIYAMSLIHQKLYQSEDIKTVDMSSYLPEFIGYLSDSFETASKIRFNLEIEPIKLGVSYAVPLSLIINEAVTNSIKYAFPHDMVGLISISLKEIAGQIILMVSDNGVGIDSGYLNNNSGTLGLKLLRGLSEDIKAESKIENSQGTTITVTFEEDEMIYATSH